jgi:hypothetical protein
VDHRSGVEFIANRDDLPIEKNLQQDKSEKKNNEDVAPLVLFENNDVGFDDQSESRSENK